MRQTEIDPYENTPRDAVVTANDYADGQHFALHSHRRGQFAYAACGVITVFTQQGNWVVPPHRAIWVPAGVPHEMSMSGPVTMLNTYIRTHAATRLNLPAQCQVFGDQMATRSPACTPRSIIAAAACRTSVRNSVIWLAMSTRN